MWQLMNEAESKTREGRPDPDALQLFSMDMGAVIKIRDPDHLVSLGTIGAGRPGIEDASYAAIASSPWIDVIVAHDYGAENDALPPATAACIRAARAAGKPCVIGEIGVSARHRVGRSLRADRIMRKIDAALLAGADGTLIWSYGAGDGVHMDIETGDPLIERLRTYVLP
jgi:endo-1,4-beta-mannosidase